MRSSEWVYESPTPTLSVVLKGSFVSFDQSSSSLPRLYESLFVLGYRELSAWTVEILRSKSNLGTQRNGNEGTGERVSRNLSRDEERCLLVRLIYSFNFIGSCLLG